MPEQEISWSQGLFNVVVHIRTSTNNAMVLYTTAKPFVAESKDAVERLSVVSTMIHHGKHSGVTFYDRNMKGLNDVGEVWRDPATLEMHTSTVRATESFIGENMLKNAICTVSLQELTPPRDAK